VPTNSRMETNQKHILAVGDVNGRFLFTHVAGAEGSVAVRRIALHAGGSMNYQRVPWCTYTDPELASIGYNEMRAREAGLRYTVLTESYGGTDRARTEDETEGRIKMLLDKKDRVIGTQIVGYHAGEMITPSLFAVGSGWKAKALMGPIYPYPTFGELHRKTVSNYMAPKLFNDRIRGILRFIFRYRGDGGEGYR
jgi:pyruvate/2-oxoglutarate dehydrogenase complex dihydrolipoamide dehydrogenase (E3) component